nr:hypothetical protein [Candidatus Freyarchaeota archaeon]
MCKDKLGVYTANFKVCRKLRRTKPVEALEIILEIVIFLVLLVVCGAFPQPWIIPQQKGQPQNLVMSVKNI